MRLVERKALAGLVAVGMFASSADAALLGLVLKDFPDINSNFISVNYDSTSNILTADGDASTIDDDGVGGPIGIDNGFGGFSLAAEIDESGNLVGGTFSISGEVPSLGFNSGTLLTGDLTGFGFNPAGGDPLEFLFSVTGGDAAGLFGSPAGLLLNSAGFDGDFVDDFGATFTAVANVGMPVEVVPEPVSASLFMIGGFGLLSYGMNRRRRGDII